MKIYKNVVAYFESELPGLVEATTELGGTFWPKIRDNTITNKELATDVQAWLMGQEEKESLTCTASTAVLSARILGIIPNPEQGL